MRLARWILASGLILAAAPLFAQTVAVGTCQPSKTSFPKIQQALNATPPGATINVCPGLYPEQILVYQAVTLKGIASGNQGAAIITVPNGGLVQNATSLATGAAIAAQILVLGAIGVKLNPGGNFLVSAHVLFPLTESGLRSKVTPVIGLDYTF